MGTPFVIPSPKNVTFTCAAVSDVLNTTISSVTVLPVRPDVNHHAVCGSGIPTVVEYPRRPAPK